MIVDIIGHLETDEYYFTAFSDHVPKRLRIIWRVILESIQKY